jgi:hypothetical protein
VEELLQEGGIDDQDEALVEGVEDEEAGAGVVLQGAFGVVVLVAGLAEGLLGVLEGAQDGDEGDPDRATVTGVPQHAKVRFQDVLPHQEHPPQHCRHQYHQF